MVSNPLTGPLHDWRPARDNSGPTRSNHHLVGRTWRYDRTGRCAFRVDDRPVVLLYGEDPAYRNMYGGYNVRSEEGNNTTTETIILEGEDILQLEDALLALGYHPTLQ